MKPPTAKKRPHITKKHGVTLRDSYFWMRRRHDPRVLKHLKAENAYTASVLRPTKKNQTKLYREILGRIKETDQSVASKDGDYFYYYRTRKGRQYEIYCRKYGSLKAREEVLLDLNALAKGHDYFDLGVFSTSPDGRFLAYSTDVRGDESYTLRIKDLRTGKNLKDEIPNTAGSAEWTRNSKELFYTTLDAAKRPYKVFRHLLGVTAVKDAEVYHERDQKFLASLYKTKDRKFIIMDLSSKLSSELHYLPCRDPYGRFRVVQRRRAKIEYSLEHNDGYFWMLTNERAKNFKLVKAPVECPGKMNWKTVIGHQTQVKLEDIDSFRDHLIIYEKHQGLDKIRVLNLVSEKHHFIHFKEAAYTVGAGSNPEFKTRRYRFVYSSLVTPNTVIDYDFKTRVKKVRKRQPVLGGFRPGRYRTERVHVKSRDGAFIPVSIVYRRGMRRNGKNPFFLYGYGSYGSSIDPGFASNRLSLLDRGFIYGIAHVRGGGELGEKWHTEGKLGKKKNTFNDFIACAKYFIRKKYTNSQNLVISGGSAGGLLMGAVVNMEPGLFRAALMHVPFVDVVNTMLDTTLPLTVTEYDEWGDPNKRNVFNYIRSYSPYDNIKAQPYPSMFVTAGLNDPRVQYWEPAKWVAKLRELKRDKNLLLLKTNLDSGHMGASGRYEYIKEIALDYAFVLYALKSKSGTEKITRKM